MSLSDLQQKFEEEFGFSPDAWQGNALNFEVNGESVSVVWDEERGEASISGPQQLNGDFFLNYNADVGGMLFGGHERDSYIFKFNTHAEEDVLNGITTVFRDQVLNAGYDVSLLEPEVVAEQDKEVEVHKYDKLSFENLQAKIEEDFGYRPEAWNGNTLEFELNGENVSIIWDEAAQEAIIAGPSELGLVDKYDPALGGYVFSGGERSSWIFSAENGSPDQLLDGISSAFSLVYAEPGVQWVPRLSLEEVQAHFEQQLGFNASLWDGNQLSFGDFTVSVENNGQSISISGPSMHDGEYTLDYDEQLGGILSTYGDRAIYTFGNGTQSSEEMLNSMTILFEEQVWPQVIESPERDLHTNPELALHNNPEFMPEYVPESEMEGVEAEADQGMIANLLESVGLLDDVQQFQASLEENHPAIAALLGGAEEHTEETVASVNNSGQEREQGNGTTLT